MPQHTNHSHLTPQMSFRPESNTQTHLSLYTDQQTSSSKKKEIWRKENLFHSLTRTHARWFGSNKIFLPICERIFCRHLLTPTIKTIFLLIILLFALNWLFFRLELFFLFSFSPHFFLFFDNDFRRMKKKRFDNDADLLVKLAQIILLCSETCEVNTSGYTAGLQCRWYMRKAIESISQHSAKAEKEV